MIASVINAVAVFVGTLLGTAFRGVVTRREDIQAIIYHAVGLISLVLGILMSMRTQRILYFALATVIGAIIGQSLGIEGGIKKIGGVLQRLLPASQKSTATSTNPAAAFLDASVLFCVGSLTIIGALQAGAEGNYSILLTKSVMDGTMAILLSAVLGAGVGLSALTIIVYQGGLTLAAGALAPFIQELMLSEISAVGGVMIMAIGLSLLGIKKIPSGNFLPAMPLVILLVWLDPWLPEFFKG